ncbi:MAG: hypothetical protein AAGU19_08110 [Prolixibacteraceae bacterium]
MSAYKLNNVDLETYGILPGMADGSIAVSGCFDLPARTGETYHEWDDEDGIEPYVDADEIFFAGRDLVFRGLIREGRDEVYYQLKQLYDAIAAFTAPVAFETPYGTFDVLVSSISPTHYNGLTEIEVKFREPVVDLTGGVLPATGSGQYTIDDIPFESFGLVVGAQKDRTALPDSKTQYYTKHGSEGYQITKRKAKKLTLTGFVRGNNLVDFISKVKALYLLFSSSGLRTLNLNNEIEIECFATNGFKVTNVYLSGSVLASFSIELLISTDAFYMLLTYAGDEILTFDENNIII